MLEVTADSKPMSAPREASLDRPGQAWCFVLAVGLLGYGLQVSNGHQHPVAMRFLIAALLTALAGIVVPRLPVLARLQERHLLIVLGVLLAGSFTLLHASPPGMYLRRLSQDQVLLFHLGLSTAAVLAGAGLLDAPPLSRWRMPALLLVHFLLGCWLIRASPSPIIDVDTMQREGTLALLRGQNPFALTFPNVYKSTALFGTKIATADRILVGFPYPPVSLLMALPGQALFGDYRYGQLLAMTLTGGLIAYARPGRVGPAVAAAFLFTPRFFFVLEQGWTDPYLLLLVAGTVFLALRRPGWVPYLFGVLASSKQYMIFAAALSWLLLRPFSWRKLGAAALKATAVAAILNLPFVLWGPKAFVDTLVLAHIGLPFRADALTYLAWVGGAQESRLASWTLLLIVGAIALAAWRCPRTPAGFASGLALLFSTFFFFGVHAFCNHYYFILGLLCIAAGAGQLTPAPLPSEEDPLSPLLARLRRA